MSAWRALVALVFQERCAGCRQWGRAIVCAACEASWPKLPGDRCDRCAGPLDGACRDCVRLAPAFTRTVASGAYTGVLREAVHALKYRAQRHVAAELADRIARQPDFPAGDWLVVPVPLTAGRLKERGFNQAALLARALAKRRRLAYADPLRRTTETAPQHALGRQAREANLAGAFRCDASVAGRRVMVVDDVLTTGATAQAATFALLEAGASEVVLAVAARTMPPGWVTGA